MLLSLLLLMGLEENLWGNRNFVLIISLWGLNTLQGVSRAVLCEAPHALPLPAVGLQPSPHLRGERDAH